MNPRRQLPLNRGALAVAKAGLFLLLIISFSLALSTPAEAQGLGSISGVVFEDLNFNQILNLHESKLAGWEINLYRENNLIQTQKTDQLGAYSFTGLKPDNYKLELKVPDGWAPVSNKHVLVNLKLGQDLKIEFANYQVIRPERGLGPITGMSITNQSVEALSPTSVKITWFTNRQAASQVVFSNYSKQDQDLILNDNNLGYPLSTSVDFQTVTFHSTTLTNLKPSTTYYYRLVALPNPKQWRGAIRVFSPELSFTTQPTKQPKKEPKVLPAPLGPTPPAAVPDKIVAGVEFEETTTPEVMPVEGGSASGGEEEEVIEEEEEAIEEPAVLAATTQEVIRNCAVYIWILLILNIAALAFTAMRSKDEKRKNLANLWWILAILVIVPVVLGDAECWLVIWLIITLIAAVALIFALSKKKDEPQLM